MNVIRLAPLACAGLLLVSGCKSYEYRLVEPAQYARLIVKEPVSIHYDPMDYGLSRYHDHVAMSINNPADEPITLRSDQSYVVDPHGESHPIRGQTIAPHSHVWLLLPPVPASFSGYAYAPYYGPPGWWYPGYGHHWHYRYDPWPYYGPYAYSYTVYTPYDWRWKPGEARLHLAYTRGNQGFEHDFVFLRQEKK